MINEEYQVDATNLVTSPTCRAAPVTRDISLHISTSVDNSETDPMTLLYLLQYYLQYKRLILLQYPHYKHLIFLLSIDFARDPALMNFGFWQNGDNSKSDHIVKFGRLQYYSIHFF